jgi:hypothetical protein
VVVPEDYIQAKQIKDRLEAETKLTGDALRSMSGNTPTGLTPDHVKSTPEWQKAKREFDAAFSVLRKFNEVYVRRFKREIDKDRISRRR